MISVRIEDHDRISIQALANRLLMRESVIYRFAINYLCSRLNYLFDTDCYGCDLLLLLIDIRYELRHVLGFKKLQLERVINNNSHCLPNKFVAMTDIELLLLPDHTLKNRLLNLYPETKNKNNIEEWLKEYLTANYKLADRLET